ncbi:MAG: hypothetical protein QOG00_64 [Pyrinomonadaceae bacterium]|nr:hypothetical protein [Pyrinomonadaceae bacterium]MDX6272084.1 hypothetical protein [Acidobacteriota bacterium]
MLSYVLLILLLTAVSLVGLLLMVKKFYWGPSGQPPRFRPHDGKLRPDAPDTDNKPSTKKAAGE